MLAIVLIERQANERNTQYHGLDLIVTEPSTSDQGILWLTLTSISGQQARKELRLHAHLNLCIECNQFSLPMVDRWFSNRPLMTRRVNRQTMMFMFGKSWIDSKRVMKSRMDGWHEDILCQ